MKTKRDLNLRQLNNKNSFANELLRNIFKCMQTLPQKKHFKHFPFQQTAFRLPFLIVIPAGAVATLVPFLTPCPLVSIRKNLGEGDD